MSVRFRNTLSIHAALLAAVLGTAPAMGADEAIRDFLKAKARESGVIITDEGEARVPNPERYADLIPWPTDLKMPPEHDDPPRAPVPADVVADWLGESPGALTLGREVGDTDD